MNFAVLILLTSKALVLFANTVASSLKLIPSGVSVEKPGTTFLALTAGPLRTPPLTVSLDGRNNLDVSIWYDPDTSEGTKSFFNNLLCPNIEKMLGTSFKMTFKPGLAGTDKDKDLWCFLYPDDCLLSKVHLCASEILPHLKQSSSFHSFACCTIANGMDGLQKCCQDAGIDGDEMTKCYQAADTETRRQGLFVEASSLFGKTVAAPAFIINTKFDEPTTLAVCEDFKVTICKMYAQTAIPTWCA